jgi:conjugative relaxase-like TrwC/TraI family protein
MMSMSSVSGGAAAGSYYSKDNYYTAEQAGEASVWQGKAAEALGLKGAVDEKVFVAVLEGKLPNGAQIQSPSGQHRAGVDLTFSTPKSLSLLALLGGDKRIEDAFRASVEKSVAWVEKNLIEARVWDKQAAVQVREKTGNLLAATFYHDVNRNGEPQLHAHVVVANATLASDAKWHAIVNDQLYKNQHLMGAIQNADFRARIEALGYETEPARNPRDGSFEAKGVTRSEIEAYSTRREEILEHLSAEGRSSPRERELAALATRKAKEPELSPEARMAGWKETAERIGFDPAPIIAASLAREAARETVWTRLVDGVRGVGAQGMSMLSSMGLTAKDGDELVPERLGRLDPVSFAAAQAVASAARELGENEAAYSRNDLILKSLERYGPLTVGDIEARIDGLVAKGLLVAGEQLMTKQSTIQLEQRIIATAKLGEGAAQPIVQGNDVSAKLQDAARTMGLHRLNQGQEKTGVDLLTSADRIHLVQGSAGTGKSASLGPVAAIAQTQGLNVIALAHANRTAKDFGQKVDAPAMTVDGFLGKYGRALDGTATPEKMDQAKQALTGSLILIDEASQIGSQRVAKLIDLSNKIDVGRLVFAGDVRQLAAIEAGKPFAQMQGEGIATSYITENLRAQTPQMTALNQALEAHDIEKAFAVLAPATLEVAKGEVATTAAKLWAGLDADGRAETLMLASGRAMRTAGNAAAQAELKARGEIGQHGVSLTALDRVTITREGARQLKGYQEGRIVEFRTNLPAQGFERGERGMVSEVKDGKVELAMRDGELRSFDPSRLARNLAQDAVTIFEPKQIELHEGDQIRWTQKDAARDIDNGGLARVVGIDEQGISIATRDGATHQLQHGDRMLERLDLAYAINVHVAQGMTAKDGIIMMSAQEKTLNSAAGFLVAVTRIAENATLVVDNAEKIERDVAHNPGGKTSAVEAAQPPAASPMDLHSDSGRDFGTGQDQPQIEIEMGRDFDID